MRSRRTATSSGDMAQSPGAGTAHPFEVPPRPGRQAVAPHRVPRWRALVAVLLNPGGASAEQAAVVPWILALAVSGAAFGLFFLQTALDRLDVGSLPPVGVATMPLVGLIYGVLGVPALALVAWLVLRVAGSEAKPGEVVRSFGLAYSPTLIAILLGLAAHVLLGWRTAVAFGVAGVLWALGPINSTLRRMSGGKLFLSIVLASICDALLLLGWALLGGIE